MGEHPFRTGPLTAARMPTVDQEIFAAEQKDDSRTVCRAVHRFSCPRAGTQAMLEFEDVAVRRQRLAELVEMEHRVWAQVAGHARVFSISNEDMERSNAENTAAVHFMRFEFSPEMLKALHGGAELAFGSDHPAYPHQVTVAPATRHALLQDFK